MSVNKLTLQRRAALPMGIIAPESQVCALWLYFAHYNFVRIHGTVRVPPAMAAGVTDHLWTIEEMLNAGV